MTFFKVPPGNLLITFYEMTMFEAPSYKYFRDILMTNFQRPNLQRAITRKKQNSFFFQIFTRLSTC